VYRAGKIFGEFEMQTRGLGLVDDDQSDAKYHLEERR